MYVHPNEDRLLQRTVYAELPDCTLAPLQRVHAAVRFVVGLRARDHVTGALIELHWLPVRYRIT